MAPTSALTRRLPWIAVGALCALLLCHKWIGADIWYHLFLGREIVLTHMLQPPDHLILRQAGYVNVYWLFQLVVWAAYAAGGVFGVSILFMVFWAAAFACWLRAAGLLRAGALGAGVWLIAVLICQTRFEERPEVVSYIFLALQVHWLATWDSDDAPTAWKYGRFALVEALWSNVHGYFAFGPILVGLRLVSAVGANVFLQEDREEHIQAIFTGRSGRSGRKTFEREENSQHSHNSMLPDLPDLPVKKANSATAASRPSCKNFRSLGLLFGLTLLASFLSPFGWHSWAEVIAFARVLRHLNHSIQELLPTWRVPAQVWTVDVFWGAWAAILAAAGWLAVKKDLRRHAFALLLAGLGLYLGATTYRNLPLFVFLCAPLLAALQMARAHGASREERGWKARLREPHPPDLNSHSHSHSHFAIAAAVPVTAAAMALWVITGGFYRSMGVPGGFGFGLSASVYPAGAADYLRAQAFSGSVFDSMADGGYLEFNLPGLRLYSDSRVTDAAAVAEYFRALRDPWHFHALRARCGFDAAVLSVTESPNVVAALYRDRRWIPAYADLHRVVFVDRITPAGSEAAIAAPRYYDGQDLSLPANETASVAWIAIFAACDDRGGLLDALRQFAAAPRVPSSLVEIAQRYAMARADEEAAALARNLRPKEFPSHTFSSGRIDELLGI